MNKHIKMEFSLPLQFSVIIENEVDKSSALDFQLAETNLIVTTMNVKGKQKGKLARALCNSLINSAA